MGYLSPPPMPAPVVVYKDVGGLVTDYQAQTEQYRRENREVRLHECRSACTLALSLPNVCVYPDAKVKFHSAYNAITREIDPGVSGELWASYPAAVRARLGYLTREYRVLTGTELIALGMRNCNGDSPTMIASRRERQRLAEAPTRLASARPQAPAGQSARGSASLTDLGGDLAQRVQTAVASAFAAAPEPGQPPVPIRVAVAGRHPLATPAPVAPAPIVPLPPRRPDFETSESAVASTEPAAGAPLPPRRPPSEAFTSADAQAEAGATPSLESAKTEAHGEVAVNTQPEPEALINGAQPILERGFVRP